MNTENIKVVFIAGYGRSGSTLLDRILGEVDDFFSLGEFRYIWERSLLDNQLCGCGKQFHNCDFWSAVIEEAFGGRKDMDIRKLVRLKYSVDRKRNIPRALFTFLRNHEYQSDLNAYTQALYKLYKAVQKVSGCKILIDSSKNPSQGYLLSSMPSIDLYVIHLVRDSRAVAYSWERKKIWQETDGKKVLMPIHSSQKSVVEWVGLNLLTHFLRYLNEKYMLLRYEDLANQPQSFLDKIAGNLGLKIKETVFHDGNIKLGLNHTVSGNPFRFKTGLIEVRQDSEWEIKLNKSKRFLITALTWPLLLKYGYPITERFLSLSCRR